MAAPTNVRVYARSATAATIKWAYAGASSVKVYRSTDGSSYSSIATVLVGTKEYEDATLDPKTKYWYKLTDDDGSTFSSVVTVISHVLRSKRQGNQAKYVAPRQSSTPSPSALNSVAIQTEQAINGTDVESQPCPLCVIDGAIVVDCTNGCEWFRVVLDQDVNSISLLGCDDCPQIDFVVPPETTRGICGWPQGCDYFGDECFQGRVPGGPHGRTAKTNGLSYDGYGPSPQVIKSCSCPNPTPSVLSIKCCSDNCALNCTDNGSIILRACHGLPPYTWSADGNVTLSSTHGTKITVSVNASSGGSVDGVWFFRPVMCHFYSECSSCGSGQTFIDIGGTILMDAYDCAGNFMFTTSATGGGDGGTNPMGASPYSNMNWTITPHNTSCSGVSQALSFNPGENAVFKTGCCDADGTVDWTFTITPAGATGINGTIWAGAPVVSATATGAIPNSVCHTPNTCQNISWDSTPGIVDARTQEMIDAGCGCDPTGATVTVTDAAGVSVTVAVA